jgi:hypothetical protein
LALYGDFDDVALFHHFFELGVGYFLLGLNRKKPAAEIKE